MPTYRDRQTGELNATVGGSTQDLRRRADPDWIEVSGRPARSAPKLVWEAHVLEVLNVNPAGLTKPQLIEVSDADDPAAKAEELASE